MDECDNFFDFYANNNHFCDIFIHQRIRKRFIRNMKNPIECYRDSEFFVFATGC